MVDASVCILVSFEVVFMLFEGEDTLAQLPIRGVMTVNPLIALMVMLVLFSAVLAIVAAAFTASVLTCYCRYYKCSLYPQARGFSPSYQRIKSLLVVGSTSCISPSQPTFYCNPYRISNFKVLWDRGSFRNEPYLHLYFVVASLLAPTSLKNKVTTIPC